MPLCTCRTQKLNTGTLTRAFYLDDEYLYIPLGLTYSQQDKRIYTRSRPEHNRIK